MADDAVPAEDVLHRREEGQRVDRRAQFFVDFTHDRVTMSFAEIHAAADEAVVALRILDGRRFARHRMAGQVCTRRDQHGLHPDDGPIGGHAPTLASRFVLQL